MSGFVFAVNKCAHAHTEIGKNMMTTVYGSTKIYSTSHLKEGKPVAFLAHDVLIPI